ncbi:MAG: non-ribosomal peptide synthetase [Phormidesmis sp.]
MNAERLEQLTTLARQSRLTMNTLVQGAWALLLSHYSDFGRSAPTDCTQVIYGSVFSGRPADFRDIEKMVGLFINTLPVSVSIDSQQSLIPWLQARQQQLLNIREYEATPITAIQRWSNLPQGSPLFESIVAFENLTATSVPETGFDVSNVQYVEQSNYPLALLVFPNEGLNRGLFSGKEGGLDLRLLYDTSRFEAAAISRLLDHLEQLLVSFVTQPQCRLGDLPRLTPADQSFFNESPTGYPYGLCIHQLIEAQAARSPQATAITFAGHSLTYTQLNQQANQLAHCLRSHGVTPGKRIALCLHRSLVMVVGILAILKAGAAYVPLDPTYPQSRLDYCLQDINPHLIVTQQSVLLSGQSVPFLYLDKETFKSYPTTNPENLTQPQDPAYIIYTSGSTGHPKGVVVSHRNLVHSTTARFQVYAQPVKRFLLLSSIAFDSSIAGLFWTLCQGGTLVLSPRYIEQDLQQLAGLIDHHQITHTLCVPTLYDLLLNSADLSHLTTLQTVIVAGEACSRRLAQQHYRKLPTTDLYNEYGPTEGSVWCSAYRVPAALPPGPISIGKPIPNTQIHLLNRMLQPVPIGAVGEIYISGDGVTQGYLNQPEKTADAYVKASCLTGSSRSYRTGDLGRYRSDGNLEWLGRCDRQVKIRGYRIELSEIEDALRAQESVQEAIVVAQSQPTFKNNIESIEELVAALKNLSPDQAEALLMSVETVATQEAH